MTLDLAALFRFLHGWLFRLRWTPRRALVTVALLILFPLLLLVTWLGLAVDTVAFRGYRRRPVTAPVFIVGNFRSGTTFLHRLLVQDRQFSAMSMWEILFAPSVAQRRVVRALASLDRRLGRPLGRRLRAAERDWARQNVMHRVNLDAPEEDEYLLLWIWSALTVGLSSGLLDQARPYAYFDTLLPARQRARVMRFYRGCIQRHLHARAAPAGVRYLAKNPALCPKLGSLLEQFPDAHIVYLVRNPLEAVPSFLSMMRFSWQAVGVPADERALREFLLEMCAHWYRYPLEVLAQRPARRHMVVRYDDLVRTPDATVRKIYRCLGLEVSPRFAQALRRAELAQRQHVSAHAYSPETEGLDRRELRSRFADVIQRFRLDRDDEASRPPVLPSTGNR